MYYFKQTNLSFNNIESKDFSIFDKEQKDISSINLNMNNVNNINSLNYGKNIIIEKEEFPNFVNKTTINTTKKNNYIFILEIESI